MPAARHDATVPWGGLITAVQPRIRTTRSFNVRTDDYLGYVFRIDGEIGGERREFLLAVDEKEHGRHGLRAGDRVAGLGAPVAGQRVEVAELQQVGGIAILGRDGADVHDPPPWRAAAPPLEVYRDRGHRRLDPHAFDGACSGCRWGCRTAVEIVVDGGRVHRTETCCFGPIACRLYKAGPARVVPGPGGTTWEEGNRVDEEAVAHREPEE